MCGIAGLLTLGFPDPAIVARMTRTISHRGPDDEGIWTDPTVGIGLGHRRLSILDLSPRGRQPMQSHDGRWIITYNGEIYNHAALRAELDRTGEAANWRGVSDTETLLACISAWGVHRTVRKSVGMFAFAVWDQKQRLLYLGRDRFGEKPLYYGWAGRDFLFASELKAIRAHPCFNNAISRKALALFTARGYVPSPLSIYEHIFKLEPGCILTVSTDFVAKSAKRAPMEGQNNEGLRLRRYWSYRDVVRKGLAEPIPDEQEALDCLNDALSAAVARQSVADVPIGAFLSGGIDSSVVVALYQRYSSVPVRTFSIGFEETSYDEAQYAKEVARQLGTVHNENYVTVKEARDVIPLLPKIYDEPFADPSQIPTYLVSQFAREQVTVALTGDGGDELFAGYNRHFVAPSLWRKLQLLPLCLRALVGAPLSQIPPAFWNATPARTPPNFGAKIQKAFRVAGSATSFEDVYSSFIDEWNSYRLPVIGVPCEQMSLDLDVSSSAPDAVKVMYCDAVSYLPDDILCKVDRAAMAVSLETRIPFLDHRVVEVAARIPIEMKVHNGQGKHILRKLLYRYASPSLFDRPKTGFGIPVGEWLKGPLRAWAEDLLESRRMAEEGWFDPAIVQRRWHMHLSGRRDSTSALWTILMFQAWYRQQAEPRREAA